MSTLSTNGATESRWTRIWNSKMGYSFRSNPVAVVSLAIFLIIAMGAIFAR